MTRFKSSIDDEFCPGSKKGSLKGDVYIESNINKGSYVGYIVGQGYSKKRVLWVILVMYQTQNTAQKPPDLYLVDKKYRWPKESPCGWGGLFFPLVSRLRKTKKYIYKFFQTEEN